MGRFIIVSIVIAACTAEEPTPDQRCERVRDRLIDLRLANATGVDIAAHRAALKNALGDSFIESCKTTLTVAQQQCVLDARDAFAANACSKEPRL
jgi:hypothetical protein